MKKIISIFLIPFLLLLNGCQTSSPEPEEVLSRFFEALYEKDFSAAEELATQESKDLLVLLEYGTKTNPEELAIFNPKEMEMGIARIKGNTALVPVKENSTSHSLTYTLIKEENKWRVAFDNFPQLEESAAPNDPVEMDAPLDEVLEKLDEVNFDSLKQKVKRDLKRKEKQN